MWQTDKTERKERGQCEKWTGNMCHDVKSRWKPPVWYDRMAMSGKPVVAVTLFSNIIHEQNTSNTHLTNKAYPGYCKHVLRRRPPEKAVAYLAGGNNRDRMATFKTPLKILYSCEMTIKYNISWDRKSTLFRNINVILTEVDLLD